LICSWLRWPLLVVSIRPNHNPLVRGSSPWLATTYEGPAVTPQGRFICSPQARHHRFCSVLDGTTLDASGNVVEQGSQAVDLSSFPRPPGFFGLVASKPFRALRVIRRSATGAIPGNWVADDLSYSIALAPGPAVPAVSRPLLAALAVALGLATWRLSRARTRR
jgi:hypothetical protein